MRIIACGNRNRNDDGAALVVAERLRSLGVEVTVVSGEAASLIETWKDADDVIIIDTVVSGTSVGTVHLWDSEQSLPLSFAPASTHGLGVAEAIEFARTLGLLPARLRLYGIEGQDFGFGTNLSPELLPAIGKVVALVFARTRMSTAELPEQMFAA
jgi:hydrogenase maturation protease